MLQTSTNNVKAKHEAIQRDLFDRVERTINFSDGITGLYNKDNFLIEPIKAEGYGYESIELRSTVGSFDLKNLLDEFKYVHFLNGKLVISD